MEQQPGKVFVPCDENDPDIAGGFTSTDGQSLCYVKEITLPASSSIEGQKEEWKGWRWEQIDGIIRNNVLIEKKTVEWCLSAVSVLKTMLSKHKLDAGVAAADALTGILTSTLNNQPAPPTISKEDEQISRSFTDLY